MAISNNQKLAVLIHADNAQASVIQALLHDNTVDGFCLVSSVSDFTSRAPRIREDGKLMRRQGYLEVKELPTGDRPPAPVHGIQKSNIKLQR